MSLPNFSINRTQIISFRKNRVKITELVFCADCESLSSEIQSLDALHILSVNRDTLYSDTAQGRESTSYVEYLEYIGVKHIYALIIFHSMFPRI